jgi:hypothetical protein
MAGMSVVLDCSRPRRRHTVIVDEIVEEVLLLRQADRLEFTGSSARIAALAARAANRGVADRLSVAARAT